MKLNKTKTAYIEIRLRTERTDFADGYLLARNRDAAAPSILNPRRKNGGCLCLSAAS